MKQSLGRFVVADPAVCHGRPTFRGTRIFVSDVLDDVARGMAWEAKIGQTRAGRYLQVIYAPDPGGESAFVITAYDLKPSAKRAFRRRQRRKGR